MKNLSIGSLLLWIGAIFVLYIVGSVLIPPLFIPKISREYEDTILKIRENPPVTNVERVMY